jgi:hypothetical protein
VTEHLVPLEVWADEGRRAAPGFSDVAAAIVTGRSPEAAAAVALGIARACAAGAPGAPGAPGASGAAGALGPRRVAVADLVGGIPSLRRLDGEAGLYECLRDAYAVSDIGWSVSDAENVYVLPSGQGPIAERWVFESARWDRLIGGFREVDALLLLVTPPNAPGLDVLISRVDGVVAVDLPPAAVRAWPLLALVEEPEQELPEIQPTPRDLAAIPAPRKKRQIGRWILAGGLALAAAAYFAVPRLLGDDVPTENVQVATEVPEPTPESAPELEVSIGPPVNPGDSAIALRFSVELVAANTLKSANSRLTSRGDPYPVPTVAPVVLQPGTAPWYRALVGAFSTRSEAEAWLAEQRALGLIRPTAGRVLDAPFALLLEEGALEQSRASVTRFAAAGVAAYALQQDGAATGGGSARSADGVGKARVFVGAFETASQALWYAAELRSRGFTPALAYRSGRMF